MVPHSADGARYCTTACFTSDGMTNWSVVVEPAGDLWTAAFLSPAAPDDRLGEYFLLMEGTRAVASCKPAR